MDGTLKGWRTNAGEEMFSTEVAELHPKTNSGSQTNGETAYRLSAIDVDSNAPNYLACSFEGENAVHIFSVTYSEGQQLRIDHKTTVDGFASTIKCLNFDKYSHCLVLS